MACGMSEWRTLSAGPDTAVVAVRLIGEHKSGTEPEASASQSAWFPSASDWTNGM